MSWRIGAGRLAALMAGALLAASALPARAAEGPTPFGLWKPGENETGAVRLYDQGGLVFGRIEAVDPADEGKLCAKCPDDRAGKPLKGLVFLRNLARQPDGWWSGGDVLDPTTGKIYNVQLKVAPDGQSLGLRGYIGNPLFGLTRTWTRLGERPAAVPTAGRAPAAR